ncbi:unnamed protein product [Fusarium langsethiae]|nr:unnamed protein product [Fusarium langsethiae]
MSPPHHHYRESDIHASPLKPTITSRTFEANPIGSLSRSPRPSRPWQRDRASVRASPPLLCAALLVARPSPTESLQTSQITHQHHFTGVGSQTEHNCDRFNYHFKIYEFAALPPGTGRHRGGGAPALKPNGPAAALIPEGGLTVATALCCVRASLQDGPLVLCLLPFRDVAQHPVPNNVVDLYELTAGRDVRTTIMLRNIPNKVD